MNSFKNWFYAAEELGGTSTASVAGAGDDNSVVPVFRRKKKRKMFDVPPHVFKRFENNQRVKYERWAKYLGSGLYEDAVRSYIQTNRNAAVVLRNLVTGEVKNITSVE